MPFILRHRSDGRVYVGWDEQPKRFESMEQIADELEAYDPNLGRYPTDDEVAQWEVHQLA